jgi:NADH-quinone oxidoreductase subunit J
MRLASGVHGLAGGLVGVITPPVGGPSAVHLSHASAWAVFGVGAALILAGAIGVVLLRNPVHCALMLVVTLFGVAVLFIDQAADFLAAVQIIVYAGAIVILFLFVIMLLGVDRKDAFRKETFRFQRPLAAAAGVAVLVEIFVLARVQHWSSGRQSVAGPLQTYNAAGQPSAENVQLLGQTIYTRYLLPFEMTGALLVIAVVAAVVLARRRDRVAGEMTREEQKRIPPPDKGAAGSAPPTPPSATPDEAVSEPEAARTTGEGR